jgi:hypothetical protein
MPWKWNVYSSRITARWRSRVFVLPFRIISGALLIVSAGALASHRLPLERNRVSRQEELQPAGGSRTALNNDSEPVYATRDNTVVQSWDAGRVFAGEPASRVFHLSNPFDEESFIEDGAVSLGCGACTKLKLSSRELRRGEETTATMTVDTAGKKGGLQKWARIRWCSSSGRTHATELRITADVVPPLHVEPAVLLWTESEAAEGEPKQVTITSELPIDWQTLEANVAAPYFHAQPDSVDSTSAPRWSVVCHLPDDVEYGSGIVAFTARVSGESPSLARRLVRAEVVLGLDRQLTWLSIRGRVFLSERMRKAPDMRNC